MRVGNLLYLDHQATTPVDPRVLGEMIPYFTDSFGNPHSTEHSFGWQAERSVENAASRIGNCVGRDSEEIIFTSGATEANNLAIFGIAQRSKDRERKKILIGSTDHKSVLESGRALRSRGYFVDTIPVDSEGFIDEKAFLSAIDSSVLLVSVGLVNSEIGTIQDAYRLASIAHAHHAIVHFDAAQAPCAVNLNTISNFADLISLSAHKFYGPKGIGALVVRRELIRQIEPLLYGGGQQQNLRSGTVPVPLCVGMAAAIELAANGEAARERDVLSSLRDDFVSRVMALPWEIRLNGPRASRHPGNASLCFRGFDAADILSRLQPYLAASTGSACNSGSPEPSHVLRALGMNTDDAESTIRFGLGRNTTAADIDDAVTIVRDALLKAESAGLLQIA